MRLPNGSVWAFTYERHMCAVFVGLILGLGGRMLFYTIESEGDIHGREED